MKSKTISEALTERLNGGELVVAALTSGIIYVQSDAKGGD